MKTVRSAARALSFLGCCSLVSHSFTRPCRAARSVPLDACAPTHSVFVHDPALRVGQCGAGRCVADVLSVMCDVSQRSVVTRWRNRPCEFSDSGPVCGERPSSAPSSFSDVLAPRAGPPPRPAPARLGRVPPAPPIKHQTKVDKGCCGDADRLCLLARYRLRNSNMIDHKIGYTRIPFLQGARTSLS